MLCGKYRIRMGVHRCALAYARSAASDFDNDFRTQNTNANKYCCPRSEFACDFWREKTEVINPIDWIKRKVPIMAECHSLDVVFRLESSFADVAREIPHIRVNQVVLLQIIETFENLCAHFADEPFLRLHLDIPYLWK